MASSRDYIPPEGTPDRDPLQAWLALQPRLDATESRPAMHRPAARVSRRPRGPMWAWPIAATIILGLVWHTMAQRPHLVVTAARQYTTGVAERAIVTLSDGTQLTLAPASTLSVPANYAVANRTVALVGEAYFAVVHNAARPFMVHAGNAVITDVGTEFDVRAYANEATTRVGVAEGEVKVALSGPAHLGASSLRVGDVAEMLNDELSVSHHVDLAPLTGWRNGQLVFNNATAEQVVSDLHRWYALEIRLGDTALATRHITATFTSVESASQAIEVLRALLDARVEQQGGVIILHSTQSTRGAT